MKKKFPKILLPLVIDEHVSAKNTNLLSNIYNWWLKGQTEISKQILDQFLRCLHKEKYFLNAKFYQFFSKVLSDQEVCQTFMKSTNYFFLLRLYQQSLQKYTHIDNETSITLQRTYHEKMASNDSELSQCSLMSTLSVDDDAVIEPVTDTNQMMDAMSDRSILSELGNQFFDDNSQNYHAHKGAQQDTYEYDDGRSDIQSAITNVEQQQNNGRQSKHEKRRNSQFLNASQSNCSYKINNSSSISRGNKRRKHTDSHSGYILATKGPMSMGQTQHTRPKVHVPQLQINDLSKNVTNVFISTTPRQFFDKNSGQVQSSQLHIPIIGTPRRYNHIDQQFQNAIKQMQHWNQGARLLESIGFQLGEFIALQDYPLIYKLQQKNIINCSYNNQNQVQFPKNVILKQLQQVDNVDQKVEYCFIDIEEKIKQLKIGSPGAEMNIIRYGVMLIIYNLIKFTPQSQQQVFEQLSHPILYDITMMRKNRSGANRTQIYSLYAVILQIFKQQMFKLELWNTAIHQMFEYVNIGHEFIDIGTNQIVSIEEEEMKVVEKKIIQYPHNLNMLSRLEGYRRTIIPFITHLGLKLQQLCLFNYQISAVEEVIIILGSLIDISIITQHNTCIRCSIVEQCLPCFIRILNFLTNKQFKSRQYYIFISNKIIQLFNSLMVITDSFVGDQQQDNINQIFINIFFYQKIQVLPWLKRYAYLIFLNNKILLELSGVFLHMDQCQHALSIYQISLCQFFSNLSKLINLQLFKCIDNSKFASPQIEQCIKRDNKVKIGIYSCFQKETKNEDYQLNTEISQLPLQSILQLNQFEFNHIIRLNKQQANTYSMTKCLEYEKYLKEFLFLIDYQYGVLMQYLLIQQEQIISQQKNRQIYVSVLESLSQLFSISGMFQQLPQDQISQHITFHYTSFIKFFKKGMQEFQHVDFISDQTISCKHLQVMQSILTTYHKSRYNFHIIKIIDYLMQQLLYHNGYDKDNVITINEFPLNSQFQNMSTLLDISKRQPTVPLSQYQIDMNASYTCSDSDGWGEAAKRLGIDLIGDKSDNIESSMVNQTEQVAKQQENTPKFKINMQQLQYRKYSLNPNININQKRPDLEIEGPLNLQMVLFILSMIIDPQTEMFDPNYVVQFPLNKNVPNIPVILHKHLNNQKNKSVLQQLLQLNLYPAHQRLIRLLTNANFGADLYPLQHFDLIATTKHGETYKGHLHISENMTQQNKYFPVIAKMAKFTLNYQDKCTIYNVYNEITIMEKLKHNKYFSQIIDYGIYGSQDYIIVMHQYYMSFRKFRLSLFTKQDLILSQYGHEQSLQKYTHIFLMSYINFLKIIQRMHYLNVIHMDLKCENIFLQPSHIDWLLELNKLSTKEDKKLQYQQLCEQIMQKFVDIQDIQEMPFQLVLGDFGESLVTQNQDQDISDQLQTQHGTEFNKSPEMLLHKPYDTNQNEQQRHKITTKIDVWSAACTLYEMLTGDFLFYDTEWSRFYINVTSPQQQVQMAKQSETFSDAENLASRIRGIHISKEKRLMLGNCQPLIDLLEFQLVQNPDMRPNVQQCIHMTEHVLKKYFLNKQGQARPTFNFKAKINNQSLLNQSKIYKSDFSEQRSDSQINEYEQIPSINNSVIQIPQNDDPVQEISEQYINYHLQQVILPIQLFNDTVEEKQGPSCPIINKIQITQHPIDICQNKTVFITNNKIELGHQFISKNNIQTVVDCRQFKVLLQLQRQQQMEITKLSLNKINKQKRSKSVQLGKSQFLRSNHDIQLSHTLHIDQFFRSSSRPAMLNQRNKDDQMLSQSYNSLINENLLSNSGDLTDKIDDAYKKTIFRNLTYGDLNVTQSKITDNILQQTVLSGCFSEPIVSRMYQPRYLLNILSQSEKSYEALDQSCFLEDVEQLKISYDNQGVKVLSHNHQRNKEFKNFMLSLEELFGIIRCSIIIGGNVLIIGDDGISAEHIGLCWLMEFKRLGAIDAVATMRRRCPDLKIHQHFFRFLATWDGMRAKTGIRLLSLQQNSTISPRTQQFLIMKYPEMAGLINLRLNQGKYTCACRKTFFTIKPKAKVSYNICNCIISDEYGHSVVNGTLVDCPTSSCQTLINYYQSLYGIKLDRMIYALACIEDVVGNYSRTTNQVQQIEKFTNTDNYQLQYKTVDDIRAPLARIAIKDGWYLHYCVICGSPTHFLNKKNNQIAIIAVFENI